MSSDRNTVYRFAPSFALDLGSGALYRDGKNLGLRPKTFETLVHLLERRGRLVSKSELLEEVWPDACVTDDVLVQSIADIRRALGDDARNPVYVQTIPKRGYIFIKDVDLGTSKASFAPGEAADGGRATGLDAGQAAVPLQRSGKQSRNRFGNRSLLLAGAAAVLLLAAFSAWIVLQEDAPPNPEAPASDALPAAIAILPFEVHSDRPGYEWLGRGIPDLIRTALWQSSGLQIIGQRRLDEAGAEDGLLTLDAATAITRKVGAQRLIRGQIYQLGGVIQINAALLRVDEGKSEAEFNVRKRLEDSKDVFGAVDEICLRVLQHLAVEKGLHSSQGTDITELTTASLQAYQHYVAGMDAFLKGGQTGAERAQIELEQAVRIDPRFALARFKLAQVQQWARTWGYSRVDPTEALVQAAAYSRDLPEKERQLISGLKALWVDNDSQAALEIWQHLENNYPVFAAEAGIPTLKTWLLVGGGRMEQAVGYGRTFIDNPYMTVDDKARLSSDLARAYRSMGDYGQAARYGEYCLKLWPIRNSRIYVYFLINLGRIYLDAGRRQEALDIFQRARDQSAGDASNLTDAGWGFYMAGHRRQALQLAEAAILEDPDYGNAYHLLGWMQLSHGEFLSAALNLEKAFALTPPQFGWVFHGILTSDLPALYYAGVARQKLGDAEKAEADFEMLVQRCRQLQKTWDFNRPSLDFIQAYTYEGLAQCRLGNRMECSRLAGQIPPEEASKHHELCQNLARLAALQGDLEEAMDWLGKSIAAGAREFQHIRDNPDYEELRPLPRFQQLTRASDHPEAP